MKIPNPRKIPKVREFLFNKDSNLSPHEIEWTPTANVGSINIIENFNAYRSGKRIDISLFASIGTDSIDINENYFTLSIVLPSKANGVYLLSGLNIDTLETITFYTNKNSFNLDTHELEEIDNMSIIITGFYYTDE